MTKKQWFNKIVPELVESKKFTNNISWSSSESEVDNEEFGNVSLDETKQRKDDKNLRWIKPNIEPKISSGNFKQSSCTTAILPEVNHLSPSPSKRRPSYEEEKESPILGSTEILTKVRFQNSILPCRPTQMISIDSSSQDTRLTNECVDPFSSSSSSSSLNISVTNISNPKILQSDSSSSLNSDYLYYNCAKNKKHKKDGLLLHFQKVLCLQRSTLFIWQHEIYTNKEVGREYLSFSVKNMWLEYGNTVMLCYDLKENDDCKDVCFMMIVGPTFISCSFNINCKYKLYSPFFHKEVLYKSKKICCYYNIGKCLPYN